MLRARHPRLAHVLTLALLGVALAAAPGRAQTDYLDLREKLEAARETVRGSIAKSIRPEKQEEFPADKAGKVFRTYLDAALQAVDAKKDFPEVYAALAKWDGKTEPTCRGLCQIISSADEPDTSAPGLNLHAQGAPKASRRRSRK